MKRSNELQDRRSTVYSHLQRISSSAGSPVDKDALLVILDDLAEAVPLHYTLGRKELQGLDQTSVTSSVVELGKYLLEEHFADKGRKPFKIRREVAATSSMLFPITNTVWRQWIAQSTDKSLSPAVRTALREKLRGKKRGHGYDWVVTIPLGWEDTDTNRSLSNAIAVIGASTPSDDELDRFVLSRATHDLSQVYLTQDIMVLLGWLVEWDHWINLVQLSPSSCYLATSLLRAWDLMETSVSEAKSAWEKLTDESLAQNVQDPQVARILLDAAHMARWTAPSDIDRLISVLENIDRGFATDTTIRTTKTRLRGLRSWYAPERVPCVPDGFTAGSIQLLCEHTGLAVNPEAEKAIRRKIRAHRRNLGLDPYVEDEITKGVRAWKEGELDNFFTLCEESVNNS